MLAQMMAKELLLEYIEERLNPACAPMEAVPVNPSVPTASSKLEFTASLTDVVELGYALYSIGFFNKGRAHIKDIMDLLSATLKVNLGEYYDTSVQIRERKNPTQFLDELKAGLLRYFDKFN